MANISPAQVNVHSSQSTPPWGKNMASFAEEVKGGCATVTWARARSGKDTLAFALTESIDQQMARVRSERENDPTKAERTMKWGQLLLCLVREGRLQELDRAVDQCPRGEMLVWFSVRMFEEACLHNRLETMRFMVNHGLDVGFHAVSEAVHWVVTGGSEEEDGHDLIPTIEFLVKEKGMPVNVQRKADYHTPLHVAVHRGLFEAVRLLIELGADVNAVAKDDALPLNLAEQGRGAGICADEEITTTTNTGASRADCHIPAGNDTQKEAKAVGAGEGGGRAREQFCEGASSPRCRQASRARICGILVERGARRTWRRGPSERQVVLDRKCAELLAGDDGRSFCTFSG